MTFQLANEPPKLYFDNNNIDQHSTQFFTDTQIAEIQHQIDKNILPQGDTSFQKNYEREFV